MAHPHPTAPSHPRVRPLEPLPFEHQGAPHVAWRDPIGITPTVQVPAAVAVLMSLMDGERGIEELRSTWHELSGEDLPAEFIGKFLAELDELLLLDSPRFHEARQSRLAEFRAARVRPPAHCPGAYPDDPAACRELLEQCFERARRLGAVADGPVRGVVAPHIDLGRGSTCYGFAYEQLRRSTADLFVVLGIAHSSSCWPEPPPLVTLTRLDFATPLGVCRTDQEFVTALIDGFGANGGDPESLFQDELVHGLEHSIEFQMLFLQHLHGGRPFRVVPVLMGSLHGFHTQPGLVGSPCGLGPFMAALRQAMLAYPGEVCVVAGADLSHVGPRFGDPAPVTPMRVSEVKACDQAALTELARNSDAWFAHFAADDNARNVCSVSNLYLLRALLPESELQLLRHEVAYDPDQTVSFAAAALR